ncbi:MAG: hypothetical protein IID45_16060 [Planctomycetes bacterium]|nr:hypothetical protein [Planctomycetota bacterium]
MILTFGILSLFICAIIFGPMAWTMGSNDLKEMAAGRMDRSGEGITKAGKICGIVGTCLWVVIVFLFILANVGAPRGRF